MRSVSFFVVAGVLTGLPTVMMSACAEGTSLRALPEGGEDASMGSGADAGSGGMPGADTPLQDPDVLADAGPDAGGAGGSGDGDPGDGMAGMDVHDCTPSTPCGTVSAGEHHTCALSQGGARCWGYNGAGRLGDGTTDTRELPTAVAALSGLRALDAGRAHTCAVHMSGQVSCWGDGGAGRLGDGSGDSRREPVQVTDLSDATQVSAGTAHTCAVREGGGVVCWGEDDQGRLGQAGVGSNPATPVEVDGIDNAIQVAAGHQHSCALLANGGVRCWGEDDQGRLGTGDPSGNQPSPVPVVNLADAVHVCAGQAHSCAVRDSGGVVCWGEDDQGRLGAPDLGGNQHLPVAVPAIADAVAVACGDRHSCALHAGGGVSCWGENGAGQLGSGDTQSQAGPVAVSGISGAVAVTAGATHSCARLADGGVRCWGNNDDGRLGDGTRTDSPSPVATTGLP